MYEDRSLERELEAREQEEARERREIVQAQMQRLRNAREDASCES